MKNPWTCKHSIVAEDCSFDYEYGSQSATHDDWELRCKHCDMPVDGEQAEQVDGQSDVCVIGDDVWRVGDLDEFEIVNGQGVPAPESVCADYFASKGME